MAVVMTAFKFKLIVMFSFFWFSQCHGICPPSSETCDRCNLWPKDEYKPEKDLTCLLPPHESSPHCFCNPMAQLPSPGCILKPCYGVPNDTFCDCSFTMGAFQNRTKCHKFRCSGDWLEYETCISYFPRDCTLSPFKKSPAEGGADCSCVKGSAPSGCTLKPCTKKSSQFPCACQPGINPKNCFKSVCPGNVMSDSVSDDDSDQHGGGVHVNVVIVVNGSILVQPVNLLLPVCVALAIWLAIKN